MSPLLLALSVSGATELSSLSRYDLIRVEDPEHPEALATSPFGAVLASPPDPGTPYRAEHVPHTDRITSPEERSSEPLRVGAVEALEALNVESWHARGHTGAGVKVAIFDLQWFGAGEDPTELPGEVYTHDCWASSSCELPMENWRARFSFEEGSHGYACAEVIRDIAPDAELHLVRTNGQTTLESAVQWAIREEIDLISMSLSFFNNSFYDGTGPISEQMELLHLGGVMMVTSAGNYAEGHWRGQLTDGDLDGRADFDGLNGLWVYHGSGSRSLYITWDQHRSCGLTDLSATLRDEQGNILGHRDDAQEIDGDGCEPVERLSATVPEEGWTFLEVEIERGMRTDVQLDVYATSGVLDEGIPEGSITDPGVSRYAVAVGAVDGVGYLDNDIEGFSSWGWDGKPEIAGPDGLTTGVYGVRGFFGTSASTPAVVGALALLLSEDPARTPWDALEILQAWAVDGDRPTFAEPDPRWGAGKARLSLPAEVQGCGRKPLLLPLLLLPLALFRRRPR